MARHSKLLSHPRKWTLFRSTSACLALFFFSGSSTQHIHKDTCFPSLAQPRKKRSWGNSWSRHETCDTHYRHASTTAVNLGSHRKLRQLRIKLWKLQLKKQVNIAVHVNALRTVTVSPVSENASVEDTITQQTAFSTVVASYHKLYSLQILR